VIRMIEKVRCPKCGFGGYYTRVDGTRRCKKCGGTWKEKDTG